MKKRNRATQPGSLGDLSNQRIYISEKLDHARLAQPAGRAGLGQVFRVHEELVKSRLLPVYIAMLQLSHRPQSVNNAVVPDLK